MAAIKEYYNCLPNNMVGYVLVSFAGGLLINCWGNVARGVQSGGINAAGAAFEVLITPIFNKISDQFAPENTAVRMNLSRAKHLIAVLGTTAAFVYLGKIQITALRLFFCVIVNMGQLEASLDDFIKKNLKTTNDQDIGGINRAIVNGINTMHIFASKRFV